MEDSCRSDDRFDGKKLILTEQEWRERLSPEAFNVLRSAGTERPFSGSYFNSTQKGTYYCAGCFLPLFSSNAKYDSKTGWPSFFDPICQENIIQKRELKAFFSGKEVVCARCNGHLGHVFSDGPPPTGKRYCINSVALTFIPRKD